jgi:hypothetical protein
MASAMCPICGGVMHLSVGDDAAWYAERHPDAKFGSLVPEVCPFCFSVINVGDEVITRRLKNDNMEVEPNQRGKVSAILTNKEFGNLYVVRLDDGKELTCPRIALRKPFRNP